MSKIGQLVSDTLTEITADDLQGLTTITESPIVSKESIETITLPSSMTSIGYHAFFGCKGIKNMTIPSSITSIGEQAFHLALHSDFASSIPTSITTIGTSAFYWVGCKHLEFSNPSNITILPTNCFSNAKIETITLPNNLIEIKNTCFDSCGNLKNITIPSSVTTIGSQAFKGTTSLTTIRFLQPSGASISLPTAGQTNGAFYCKNARTGITVYTDNATIKNYAWATDNLTVTILHLDGSAWA